MFDSIIASASAVYGVPVAWINTVIQVESNWNPEAYNASDPGGARGLMQVIASTARAYGVVDLAELFDPEANIDTGTRLLRDLRAQYGSDFKRVYSAYNSGNPDAWRTSAQVAANVERALAVLASYSTPANPGIAGLLLLILGFWLVRR